MEFLPCAKIKINIVVLDSSNTLLDSLEISVTDRGIKLIQMVEEIVKDHSVDCMLIENKYRVSIKVSKTFASSESQRSFRLSQFLGLHCCF